VKAPDHKRFGVFFVGVKKKQFVNFNSLFLKSLSQNKMKSIVLFLLVFVATAQAQPLQMMWLRQQRLQKPIAPPKSM
jgi:hypothetical protein